MSSDRYETPAVSDAIDAIGAGAGVPDGLAAVCTDRPGVAGPARTGTVVDTDEPGIPGLADLLDDAAPGDMLVLGWDAASFTSVWGGLAATRTEAAGCLGLVTGGWVRDLDEVRRTSLVVWARGASPRSGKGRLAVTGIGRPTLVGGVEVSDRDLVVADATGVCVVAAGDTAQVLEAAADLQRRDETFREALATGAGFGAARRQSGTL